ncbi:MAG: pyridoxal phosphate-dependent aminotransferase [Planctomycetes bacterium]|nr:pyridoxal phosphate-dependent aminotransferase [Planctomycetota bacterium]
MLAERTRNIKPSGIRRIFELMATMEDPINLSIGQAHYDPPKELAEAACKAIRDGFNRYTVTQGLPALNERILDRVAKRAGGHRPPASLVTSGVSGGILLGFLALLDPGDVVLLPDPNFTMYRVVAEICGAEIRYYDLYPDWQPDPAQIDALVDERTKIVFLNSPSNPTGGVLTNETIDAFVRAAERVGAVIVSDEIYDAFVYDGELPSPVGRYDRVLQLGGFSKTFGVPGWRMGYATGPAELLDSMKTMQQFTFVCAPAPFQVAILETAFDLDMSSYIDDYRNKRDRLVADLHPVYELRKPAGSFYAFPKIPGNADTETFMDAALARKLLVVPGSAFSRRATHFRISFAASDADLGRGIEQLNDLAVSLT